MTKVEIDGKTYCVETLIYTVERLTKDVKASAEYHRLVLDKIIEEIKTEISDYEGCADFYEGIRFGLRTALEIIDKHIIGKENATPIPDTDNNLCSFCINVGCMFQSGIVRTECAFYIPPNIESDNSEKVRNKE